MKRTEMSFDDVKVGDTLYIESTGAEYAKCNKRTCAVVGIDKELDTLCVDFGKEFLGHSANGFVAANTGYNLWRQDKQYFTLFKVEEEAPETKYTYSGKVLRNLKVGDIFFLDKFPFNPRLEGTFYEVTLTYLNHNYGFNFKAVTDEGSSVLPTHTASNDSDVRRGQMVITLTHSLGKTKQDRIAKLEAKLERITNKLKALKESGE